MSRGEYEITHVHEDYLKAIYHLESQNERATTTAIAEAMGVSPASATNMVKKLAELNLVHYTPYQGVRLTPAGRKIALEVIRHHRLVELYLAEALGISWDKVHEEADRLEHVISEELEEAMARALGYPTVDPHGDPIPSPEGVLEDVPGPTLADIPLDMPAQITRVRCQQPEILRYLGSLGIYPGKRVIVRERAPFEGPLLIEVEGTTHALAHHVGKEIDVHLLDDDERATAPSTAEDSLEDNHGEDDR